MQKFNWVTTITANLWVLRCVGLWPDEELYEMNSYTFYAVFNGVVIIAVHNLSQITNIFFVYTDLEALTATIFVLSTNILAVVKMFFFVRNMKVIKQLLTVLNQDLFQPKSQQQVDLIRPSLKRWKVTYIVYNIMVITNVMLWCVGPALNGGQKLPFMAWYPFNINVSPNYQIVYTYQVVCIWYITAANLNLDTIIYALLMYIWSQCDILCDDMGSLRGENFEFNEKLIQCIKHHKQLVWFAKTFNKTFNMIILGQFATSTMVLALTMFQLSLVDPSSEAAFPHLAYIIGISTQLLLYCWCGNEVELKSSQIPFSLYKSEWFGQSNGVKKSLIILSERCQNPIKITALNLFALSLSTFVAILRTAWSYFALLHSVNSS